MRLRLCQDFLNPFAHFAGELTPRSVGIQFQINVQVLDLRAIVTFALGYIRQHKISACGIWIAETRLALTFFSLVQPVQQLKRFTQNDVSLGCRVIRLQSLADNFLRIGWPACLAQQIPISELRLQRILSLTLRSMDV